MMLIDAKNPFIIEDYKMKKLVLEYEQRIKGFYDVNDYVMVRTTDFLDAVHVLKPISKVPFVTNINNIAHRAIFDILKDIYNVDIWNENDELMDFNDMVWEYNNGIRDAIAHGIYPTNEEIMENGAINIKNMNYSK